MLRYCLLFLPGSESLIYNEPTKENSIDNEPVADNPVLVDVNSVEIHKV